MKVLIIGDIHGRKFWREYVYKYLGKVDKIIFLGDYLDPYPNEISQNPNLMECKSFDDLESLLTMLEDIVNLKKEFKNDIILLTGNHTDSYIWPDFNMATRTDKYNYEKYHNFFLENLNLFNLVYTQDDVIFSHAGISEGWTNQVWERLNLNDELNSIMEIAVLFQDTPLKDFDKHYIDVISDISSYRWGDAIYGSCEWADIREHINMKDSNNEKLVARGEEGIFQIFGHTQSAKPIITDKWACLDCRKGFIFDTITHKFEDGSDSSL